MATSESAFDRLLGRADGPLPEPAWTESGDLARMSIEAFAVNQEGDARQLTSRGRVRLSGAGVVGHGADLDDVGQVATFWQRCVSSVGASLEGSKSARGRVADAVMQRTQLTLNAAPIPGSIVLEVSPKSEPTLEAYPGGDRPAFDAPRPLADEASEILLDLLQQASAGTLNDLDQLGETFLRLGPRVASSVRALASTLNRAHFDLEASWSEPQQPTRRAVLPAGTSGWLADFVAGRELDGVEEWLEGKVRTVSDIERWSIETDDGIEHVDASSLAPEDVRQVHVEQFIRLLVLVHAQQRPDGTERRTLTAIELDNLTD